MAECPVCGSRRIHPIHRCGAPAHRTRIRALGWLLDRHEVPAYDVVWCLDCLHHRRTLPYAVPCGCLRSGDGADSAAHGATRELAHP